MNESRSSRLVGYGRVSTVGQTLEAQLDRERIGVARFSEGPSVLPRSGVCHATLYWQPERELIGNEHGVLGEGCASCGRARG